jgi:hypothetical protein
VRNPSGVVVFTDSLSNGSIVKTDSGASISATLAPNKEAPAGGFVRMTVSYSFPVPTGSPLVGGTGIAASAAVIPEPGTLGLLGTGLIGLAGVMKRKLKLGT